MNDLVYIQYNQRLATRFAERREKTRNFDPLLLDELDWSSEWMVDSSSSEALVHSMHDLTWRDVDLAAGASEGLGGRNFPRESRQRSGSSGSRRRATYEDSSSSSEEVEDLLNDDENVEDDFGVPPTTSDGGGDNVIETPAFIDDYE